MIINSIKSIFAVLFGVSGSHSGQIDMSLLASSELVPDQAALDKIAGVYFNQELDQLCSLAGERIIPILDSDKTQADKSPGAALQKG